MTKDMLNFFVLLSKKTDTSVLIKRISLNRTLQGELTQNLSGKIERLLGADLVDFSTQYKLESNELFKIQDYGIRSEFQQALEGANSIPVLDDTSLLESIRAIFTGGKINGVKLICFQKFDKRKVLSKNKFNLFFSQSTFTRVSQDILTIPDEISTIYRDGTLMFKSYKNTNDILDISNYYRQATDDEVREGFLNDEKFSCSDVDDVVSNFDIAARKKVAHIIDSNILSKVAPNKVKKVCKKYGLVISVKNKKIVFPTTKKDIKKFIKVLNDDYFESSLSGEKYETNSKKRLPS